MGQDPYDQAVAVADALDALLGLVGDLGDGVAGAAGQRSTLEVGPQVLDRIQLGSIGGQPLDREPVALGIQMARILWLQWALNPSQISTTRWPV